MNTKPSESLGQMIRRVREERKQSRAEAAPKIGKKVGIQQLYRWESDKVFPGKKYHKEIAEYLGITIDAVAALSSNRPVEDILPFVVLAATSGLTSLTRKEFEFLFKEWSGKPTMGKPLLLALLDHHRTHSNAPSKG